ncbi:MAG: hypothetical protein ABSB74_05685 [Tepidisphaeraceae bacterium]
MPEPNPNDPAPSEKTKPDAASPPAEIRPDSPASRRPPAIRALDAPLFAVPGTKSVRPGAPGAGRLTPKPSAAPPPRPRPAAPPESPNNIGPGALSQPPLLSDAEISATQEIADAMSNGQPLEEPEVIGNNPETAPSAPGAPMAQAHLHTSSADTLSVRRTIIPILLTGGVILAGAGALLLFGGEDNALSDLFPSWVPIMFYLLASIFLGFGVLNMLAVKNVKEWEGTEAQGHEGTK